MKRSAFPLLIVFVCFVTAGCFNFGSVVNAPEQKPPSEFVKSELYLGMAKPDGTLVTEDEWKNFLEKSVTSRFPDGLTVVDAYGQYKNDKGEIVKEKTKILIIVHKRPDASDLKKVVEDYKKTFNQECVFKVITPVKAGAE